MEVKWICKECGSVNLGEKQPHMACFVCGKERDSEILMEGKGKTAAQAGIPAPGPAAVQAAQTWWQRAKRFLLSLGKGTGMKAAAAREEESWIIRRSPADSREAYVEGIPACREKPKRG